MDLLISLTIALVSGLFVLLAIAPLVVSRPPARVWQPLRVVAKNEEQPPVRVA
jgi:hypothetical protein